MSARAVHSQPQRKIPIEQQALAQILQHFHAVQIFRARALGRKRRLVHRSPNDTRIFVNKRKKMAAT